jgi:hypothetical protein
MLTKGDEIIGVVHKTSSNPTRVSFNGKDSTFENMLDEIKSVIKEVNADGYYLCHNHPGGTIKPSNADINVTGAISDKVTGFKGHVILDHTSATFLQIISSNKATGIAIPYTNVQKNYKETIVFNNDGIETKHKKAISIKSKDDIIQTAKLIPKAYSQGIIIFTDSANNVTEISPMAQYLSDKASQTAANIAKRLEESKFVAVFIYTEEAHSKQIMEQINNYGFDVRIEDVLIDNETQYNYNNYQLHKPSEYWQNKTLQERTRGVKENGSEYENKDENKQPKEPENKEIDTQFKRQQNDLAVRSRIKYLESMFESMTKDEFIKAEAKLRVEYSDLKAAVTKEEKKAVIRKEIKKLVTEMIRTKFATAKRDGIQLTKDQRDRLYSVATSYIPLTQNGVNSIDARIDKILQKMANNNTKFKLMKQLESATKKMAKSKLSANAKTQIDDLMNKYDFAKISDIKKEALESEQKLMNDLLIAKNNGATYNLEVDQKIELLRKNTERLKKEYIGDMTVDELQGLQKDIEGVLEAEGMDMLEYTNALYGEYTDARKSAINTIQKFKRRKTGKEDDMPNEFLDEYFGSGKDAFNTVAEFMDRGKIGVFSKYVCGAMVDAASDYQGFMQAAKDFSKQQVDSKDAQDISYATENGKDWLKTIAKKGIDFTFEDGKKVKIMKSHLVSLYLHSLNPHNAQAILRDGIAFDFNRSYETKGDTKIPLYRVTENDFIKIQEMVKEDPLLLKTAKTIYTQLNTTNRKALRETSAKLKWQEMVTTDNYFSLPRIGTYVDPKLSNSTIADIVGYSATDVANNPHFMSRNPNAKGIVVIEDALISSYKSTALAAAYKAYALPLRFAKNLLKETRVEARNYGILPHHNRLTQLIQLIEGRRTNDESVIEDLGTKILNTSILSVFSLNLIVAVRNIFAYQRVLSNPDVPYSAAARAVFLSPLNSGRKKELKEMVFRHPQLRSRIEGGYANPELSKKAYTRGLEEFYDKPKDIRERGTEAIAYIDRESIYRIANLADLMIGKNESNREQKIADLTFKLMTDSQSMYAMEFKSAAASKTALLPRLLTLFTSDTNAAVNQLVRAINRVKFSIEDGEDPKKHIKGLIRSILWGYLSSAMAMLLVDGFADFVYKRKTDAKMWTRRAIRYAVSPIYLSSGIEVVINGMLSGLNYEDGKLSYSTDDLYKNFIKDSEINRAYDNMLDALGTLSAKVLKEFTEIPGNIEDKRYGELIKFSINSLDLISKLPFNPLSGVPIKNIDNYIEKAIIPRFQKEPTPIEAESKKLGYNIDSPRFFTQDGEKYHMDETAWKTYQLYIIETANTMYDKKEYEALDNKDKKKYLKEMVAIGRNGHAKSKIPSGREWTISEMGGLESVHFRKEKKND